MEALSRALILRWGGSYALAGVGLSLERLCCGCRVHGGRCSRRTFSVCRRVCFLYAARWQLRMFIRLHLCLSVRFLRHLCVRGAGHVAVCLPFCACPSNSLLCRSLLHFCSEAVTFFVFTVSVHGDASLVYVYISLILSCCVLSYSNTRSYVQHFGLVYTEILYKCVDL